MVLIKAYYISKLDFNVDLLIYNEFLISLICVCLTLLYNDENENISFRYFDIAIGVFFILLVFIHTIVIIIKTKIIVNCKIF